MNAYLLIMHEVQKVRLARQAQKERSSPTGSPPEGHKCTSEGGKAMHPVTKEDSSWRI